MAEPFIGEIRMFPFSYTPKSWADCNGQTVLISQNRALFAFLGKTYGGDGTTNFALPDLRGRVPVCAGQGTGLSNYARGATGGATKVTLTTQELPVHTHPLRVISTAATTKSPANGTFAQSTGKAYTGAGDATGSAVALASSGIGQAHSNEQPYLSLRFCIALYGLFHGKP